MPLIELPESDNAYVTIAEIRALPNLGDVTKFTNDELGLARDWFETKFEQYTGMAFIPRLETERVNGTGSATLYLSRWPVREVTAVRVYTSASLNTAYTATELADLLVDSSGGITRFALGYWTYGNRNIEVDYTHGQESPPADIKDAALVAIRQKLLADHSGDRGNRQLGIAQEGVFVRNTQGPFFNDEVNDIANAYRAMYRVPAVA